MRAVLISLATQLYVSAALAQATATATATAKKSTSTFSFFTDVLGVKGVLISIGLLFFFASYRYAPAIFRWIEDQTYGTRDYVLQKFEIMHIQVAPNRVTLGLVLMSFGSGLFVFACFAIFGNFMTGLVFGAMVATAGWKAPRPIVNFLEERRKKIYTTQMVDALNLLANGIRAGLSMPQAIGMVVDELPAPISQEFNLILQQAKIGVPLEEALDNLNKRVKTQDNEMFVSSVNILRETGGNLAEVFDTIVFVIRERVRLQQKIDTYTASGMFQGIVIFAMPYAMIAINGASDSEYLKLMFTTVPGIIMFILIMIFSGVGMWVIMKIVKIEV